MAKVKEVQKKQADQNVITLKVDVTKRRFLDDFNLQILSWKNNEDDANEVISIDWGNGTKPKKVYFKETKKVDYANELISKPQKIKYDFDTNENTITLTGNVKYLRCAGMGVQSLDVRRCPSLVYLYCNDNNLTELDISGCPALKLLDLNSNKITEINFSQNVNLEDLRSGNNLLTTIDVSQNEALTYLNCCMNKLTALDVSKNVLLKSLNCNINQFTTLDVSQNPKLIFLDCSNNNLTTLDVSGIIRLGQMNYDEDKVTIVGKN